MTTSPYTGTDVRRSLEPFEAEEAERRKRLEVADQHLGDAQSTLAAIEAELASLPNWPLPLLAPQHDRWLGLASLVVVAGAGGAALALGRPGLAAALVIAVLAAVAAGWCTALAFQSPQATSGSRLGPRRLLAAAAAAIVLCCTLLVAKRVGGAEVALPVLLGTSAAAWVLSARVNRTHQRRLQLVRERVGQERLVEQLAGRRDRAELDLDGAAGRLERRRQVVAPGG